MRKVVLTAALMLASGTAMASSIEVVHGSRTANDSIIAISCEGCPRPAPKSAPQPVITLQPGTQSVSIRDIGGHRQTVRTEAWLGGSPVTFVSSNPIWLPQENAPVAADAPVQIDSETTTAAVERPTGRAEGVVDADLRGLDSITSLPLRQSN